MKKLLALLFTIGLFISAQAAVIDLGYTGGQPADVASEMNRLNVLIGNYNFSNDPDLLLATAPLWSGVQTEVDGDQTSITLNLAGFDGYLLFKYGPVDRFYYLNDNIQALTAFTLPSVSYGGDGLYTFYSDVYNFTSFGLGDSPPVAGLSHYTTFSAVPEPATWWAGACLLLPFALSTMRGFRRSSV